MNMTDYNVLHVVEVTLTSWVVNVIHGPKNQNDPNPNYKISNKTTPKRENINTLYGS